MGQGPGPAAALALTGLPWRSGRGLSGCPAALPDGPGHQNQSTWASRSWVTGIPLSKWVHGCQSPVIYGISTIICMYIYIWDYMVHIWVRNHLLSGMHIQVSNWPKKIYWKSKWIWNDLWDLRHSTSKPFVGRGKALLLKRNFGDMGWLAAKVQWSPLGPQCWDLLDVSLFQRQLCTLQEMTVEPSKLTCTHKTMRTPQHCKSRSHGPNS